MLKNIYKIYIAVNLIAPIPIVMYLWAEPINLVRILLQILVVLWLVPVLLVLFFKHRNPTMSAYMLQTTWQLRSMADKQGIVHRWVAAGEIGTKISLAAIIAEDIYFFIHAGFDGESMRLAFQANQNNQPIRGGSTITQQVAKNLFLWPARSYLRKIVEAYFTMLIEGCWSKRRVLEVYLNIIQFSEYVFGVQAAAELFFDKQPKQMSEQEAALLVAVLPNPLMYRLEQPSHYVRYRQLMILAGLKKNGEKLGKQLQSIGYESV